MSTGILRLQGGSDDPFDLSVLEDWIKTSSSSTGGPSTTVSYEPPWIEQMRRGYLGNAWDWAKQPTPIPTQQYAGLDPYELQARGMVGGLGGFQPYIQQAGGAYGQGLGAVGQGMQAGYYGAQGYDPAMGKSFYNPYEENVVQQSLADVYKSYGAEDVGARAGAVGQGAYGGGRGRLMAEERFKQLGRGMTEAAGGLRHQGYTSAQQQAQQAFADQQRRMQQAGAMGLQGAGLYGTLGQGIAGIGQMGQNMLMNQINLTNTLGSQARGIADKRLAAQYQTAQGLAGEPLARLGALGQMIQSMLPTTRGAGVTTKYGAAEGQADVLKAILDYLGVGGDDSTT
jgi:hypothetical protein